MTPEQVALVRDTWALARPNGTGITAAFYARLFEIWPAGRSHFATTNLEAQQRKLLAMLDEIVRQLEHPGSLIPQVAALGKRHAQYGVRARDYQPVGDALIWVLEQGLGPAFTPAAREAWHAAYRLLESVMVRATQQTTGEWPVPADWRTAALS